MKINGKLIESFGNVFDSSLVDYSSDYENNDRKELEKGFLNSLYLIRRDPNVQCGNIYKTLEKPNEFDNTLRNITYYFNKDFIIEFKEDSSNVNLYITLKGRFKLDVLNKDLFYPVEWNGGTNPMENFSEILELFGIDFIDYDDNDFFTRWDKIMENDKLTNNILDLINNLIKRLNDYIDEIFLMFYIKDRSFKKYFEGKKLNIIFKINSPRNEIIKIVEEGYNALLNYLKNNPKHVLDIINDTDMPEDIKKEYFNKSNYPFYKFDKGEQYISQSLNKLKTTEDIDEFFADLYTDDYFIIKDLETVVKWDSNKIDKFITAWNLYINDFGMPESLLNDPSMGRKVKDENFLLDGIELHPIKCKIISDIL